jgi:predicted nucleic acid-binding protein
VTRVVVLDSSPLGLLSNPNHPPEVVACRAWAAALQAAGHRLIIPEIADYEVRRELIRARKVRSLRALDRMVAQLKYLPLTTAAIRQAAEFWAAVRQAGLPTSGPADLDGDAILAAQAVTLGEPNVLVATTNVGHLARFVAADLWSNITP